MDYPLTKCFRPLKIYNRYAKQTLLVPCGKCKACLLQKSSLRSLECQFEEQQARFCLFITLTYSPKYVPLFRVLVDKEAKEVKYINLTKRIMPVGSVIQQVLWSSYFISEKFYALQKRCKLNGDFSYLYYPDIKKFLKRLRKLVDNERLRFYFVGEYGSKYFRCHSHCLLYFNSPETLRKVSQNLSSLWSYGRVDFSLSRGQTSNYCASYVNSFVSLPQVFREKAVRPFQTHSTHFASSLGEEVFEALFKNDIGTFIEYCETQNFGNVPLYIFRSFKRTYLPKCRNFLNSDIRELYRAYTLFNKAKSYYGIDNCFQLGNIIFNDGNGPWKDYFFEAENAEQIIRDLYLSKYFLLHVCSSSRCVYTMITKIVEFYKYMEYENLKKFYQMQADLFNEIGFQQDVLELMYSQTFIIDDFEKIDSTQWFKSFYCAVCEKSYKKIKHKHINDLNKIFL